ncbi:MAG TPA: hypothetical protein VF167_10840 [Longimicrobiaceae bacterium]
MADVTAVPTFAEEVELLDGIEARFDDPDDGDDWEGDGTEPDWEDDEDEWDDEEDEDDWDDEDEWEEDDEWDDDLEELDE